MYSYLLHLPSHFTASLFVSFTVRQCSPSKSEPMFAHHINGLDWAHFILATQRSMVLHPLFILAHTHSLEALSSCTLSSIEFQNMGWEGGKLKREQNRANHPFSLNKITRHPENTKLLNELPRSMVTTQGRAGQKGRLPGTSCAEKSSKVQYPVCSHHRYFLATADLQVSFEALKTPDPLWHTLHFGGVFTLELRDHIQ